MAALVDGAAGVDSFDIGFSIVVGVEMRALVVNGATVADGATG